MQEPPIAWPHWVQTAFGWLASGIAGGLIVRLYTTWLNRRKPAAEIHRTHAESTEIFIRAGAAASDSISRMIEKLELAQERSLTTIDRLRQERDGWKREYDREFKLRKEKEERVDLLIIEADSLKDQMEGAYNYIKFLGRHPTDVDKFRVQLKEENPKLDVTYKKGQPHD